MIEYIRKNKNFLSIRAIEEHLGMPSTTLQKEIDGSQKMSKKWYSTVENFVNELRK